MAICDISPGGLSFLGRGCRRLSGIYSILEYLSGNSGILFRDFIVNKDYYSALFLPSSGRWGFSAVKAHRVVGSETFGNVLASGRNVYAFGMFNVELLSGQLGPSEPTSLARMYSDCGFRAAVDAQGFRKVFDIPGPRGRKFGHAGLTADRCTSAIRSSLPNQSRLL